MFEIAVALVEIPDIAPEVRTDPFREASGLTIVPV
jgi:hypothetical protein